MGGNRTSEVSRHKDDTEKILFKEDPPGDRGMTWTGACSEEGQVQIDINNQVTRPWISVVATERK